MNNDRELMQDALDALTYVGDKDIYSGTIDALRARLAQPENDFNPDWDAMAVMVEEQQRMAKRIEELEARLAQPEQEGYLCENAVGHKYFRWKKPSSEYKPIALYTAHASPQRIWQGLTDEEVVVRANAEVFAEAFARGAAWAELKLKEKNNG